MTENERQYAESLVDRKVRDILDILDGAMIDGCTPVVEMGVGQLLVRKGTDMVGEREGD